MPIVFEHVSFSYSAQSKKKRKRKDASGAQPSPALGSASVIGTASESASPAAAKPDWGKTPDAIWALRDISLTVEDGEFFGIAGHTGSGKSTLIQHMNGLVHPTEGRVLIDGEDLADKKSAARFRGKVGLVFQYPEHQLFATTVYEDVAFGPRNMGLTEDEVDKRVREALSQVGLDYDEIRNQSPFEQSGGQQRRIAFAGVLAMKPSVLVLDEPVAGLDPTARDGFLDFLSELNKSGLTIIMVSHSMNNLADYCDRVLILKEGEQFILGTPEEVFTQSEQLNAIGLSAPSSQRLADALIAGGIPLSNCLYDAERLASDLEELFSQKMAVNNA